MGKLAKRKQTNSKKMIHSESKFQKIHQSFFHNFESLKEFVKHLRPVVTRRDEKMKTNLHAFIKRMVKHIKKKSSAKVKNQLNDKFISDVFLHLEKDKGSSAQNTQLLYNSSFTMLVSYIDYLIYDVMHYYYKKFPQAFGSKQLTSLTLEDLLLCGSLKEAISDVINAEIDSILNKNFDAHIRYLRDNLKIDIPEGFLDWPKIKEIIERRHLIVHNNCKITDRYINFVKKNKLQPFSQLKREDSVNITNEYFISSFYELYLLCSMLIQICWRKWEADTKRADSTLINEDIYFLLKQDNYYASERLCKFAESYLNILDEQNRKIIKIDYLISLKFQNKHKELALELKTLDVSSLRPVFQMAVAALKDDKVHCLEKMKEAVACKDFDRRDFEDWPLFKLMRKDKQFRKNATRLLRIGQKRKS